MYQHAKYKRYIENLKLRGNDRNQLLDQRSLGCLIINPKGTSVDDVEKYYQYSGLVSAGKIDISINQLIELSQYWIDKYSGRTIGAAGYLVNKYYGVIYGTMLDDLEILFFMYVIQNIVPTLMERLIWLRQEVIILRLVTNGWKIIELLVGL